MKWKVVNSSSSARHEAEEEDERSEPHYNANDAEFMKLILMCFLLCFVHGAVSDDIPRRRQLLLARNESSKISPTSKTIHWIFPSKFIDSCRVECSQTKSSTSITARIASQISSPNRSWSWPSLTSVWEEEKIAQIRKVCASCDCVRLLIENQTLGPWWFRKNQQSVSVFAESEQVIRGGVRGWCDGKDDFVTSFFAWTFEV